MKNMIVILMISMSLLSCRVNDLYYAVDNYAFIVRMADLTAAVLDDTHTIDWQALQQLQLRYNVDLVEPTNQFLIAASTLKQAYSELQESISTEQQNIMEIRALSDALHNIKSQ